MERPDIDYIQRWASSGDSASDEHLVEVCDYILLLEDAVREARRVDEASGGDMWPRLNKALSVLPAIPPKGAGREWLKRMTHEEDKQDIYIPPSPGKFAVFGPGMSGTTDDFGLAQAWLLNNPKAVLYYARAEPKAALFDEMLDALREHQKFGGLDDLIQRADALTGKEPAE